MVLVTALPVVLFLLLLGMQKLEKWLDHAEPNTPERPPVAH
jgi:uncharacterized short protein YbdD (DUF466 family)